MRRWQQNLLALLVAVALAAAFVILLGGCAAEGQTLKSTAYVAGGGAGGSFFGPVGAGIGAAVAYLFGAASAAGEGVQHMNLGGRIGSAAYDLIWWCLAGYAILLLLVPKCRDNLLAVFFSKGTPFADRLKSLVAGLIPSPHSPPAAQERKAKRENRKHFSKDTGQ